MIDKGSGQSGKSDSERKAQTEASDPPKKSLSQLLSEWDESDKGADDKGKESKSELERLKSEIEVLKRDAADRSYQSGISQVIATLKGDLEVDDFLVEAWANKQANDDPRLLKLWEQRHSKRREFAEAIEALRPDFQKYAQEKILANTKEDKGNKGLAAAVRGARDASPSNVLDDTDWSGLTDAQFALKKAEVFRLAAAGKLR